MSEAGPVVDDGVTGGVTAGGMLKAARHASGMHIAALSVALKVPVKKLEALEADDYVVLPDTVFVRALASSVCRTLKVDAAPILALLPQSRSPHLRPDSGGLNAPFKERPGKASDFFAPSLSLTGSASRLLTFVGVMLLAGALALVYFPRASEIGADVPSSFGAGKASGVVGEEASMGEVKTTPPSIQGRSDLLSSVASSVAPIAEVLAFTAATAASAPATAASEAREMVAPSAILLIRARRESWVQVKDSTGTMVLQRNLAAAESISLSGAVPLSVVIGRADVTDVFVRGKPFELGAASRENVARFEVK